MNLRSLILISLALGALITGISLEFSSDLSAAPAEASQEAVCKYHGIAVNLCTRCDPDLIPAFKEKGDWCAEHNLPESQCDICQPDLRTMTKTPAGASPDSSLQTFDWCADHRVPESECTKCNPSLVAGFKGSGDWCGGHDVPESHCYLCNPGLKFEQETEDKRTHGDNKQSHAPNTSLYRQNSAQCATDNATIQLASIQTADRIGLEIITVNESPASAKIDVPAEVEYDATEAAAVTCPVSGTLVQWVVTPGEIVHEGQILAYIESMDAATKKAEYAHAAAILELARQTLERKRQLDRGGMANARELQEAETEFLRAQADFHRAQSILRTLRLTDAELVAIANQELSGSIVSLRARRDGRLVEQIIALGTMIDAGQSIGLISQTERLWVKAWIRESELSRIQVGQPVSIAFDGNGWKAGRGRVVWIADGIDPKTRMGKVRIEAVQNGMLLRAHQFVRVLIETDPVHAALLIPADAVQWEGCCNIVFVQESPDRYRPHKIKLEFADGNSYAVRGLNPGSRIVSKGSYMLKTELMKSSIGAGCCGVGA